MATTSAGLSASCRRAGWPYRTRLTGQLATSLAGGAGSAYIPVVYTGGGRGKIDGVQDQSDPSGADSEGTGLRGGRQGSRDHSHGGRDHHRTQVQKLEGLVRT